MTELMEKLAADVGGRYVVERELGRGGMATVYLARDLLDERRVAIKVMDPELSAAVGAERFKREIAVASRLEHPHILGIIASGEAAGTMYYVMPYVQGESLRDRLNRETQLPMEEAIRIAREVADALDYAHRQGVVHRDIKPENILLEGGRALVADFGIARAAGAEDNSTLTKTGTALGTPHYMSPEQVMGEKRDIDGRTDQYALGCMLYEMLAGQPPFTGPHAQSLMAQHVMDEPPYVTRFRQSTPQNVEDAVLVALAKKKVDRFPTMREFIVALENTGYTSMMVAARKMRETQAQAAVPPARAAMPTWKKAALAATAFVVLGAGTAGAWSVWSRPRVDNAAVRAEMKRIAVLYFTADGGGDLPALADGITEDVIARLRQVRELSVVSRDGVAAYRGRQVADSAVASALRVGVVVTGSLRQDGNELVITARLHRRTGDAIGRPIVVRRPVGAAIALRDSVADRIATELRRQVGESITLAAGHGGAVDPRAWTLLQHGARARRDADSLARAEQVDVALLRLDSADAVFRQAASLDPNWTAPHVARANTALLRLEILRDRRKSAPWVDSAEAAAGAALALADDDAEARAARGTARAIRVLNELVTGREADEMYARAAADLDTAVLYDPTLASAYNERGRLEYYRKQIAAAKNYTFKAYEADAYLAQAPNILYRLFITSHDLNQAEDAEKYCDEGSRRFPSQTRFTHCRLMVMMMPGQEPTAARIWRVVDSLEKSVPPERWRAVRREVHMFAAVALIRAGLPDSGRRVMLRARPDSPADDPNAELLSLEALVLAQLGETARAAELMERYVSEHPEHVDGFRKADFWWWRPLHGEPGFQRILALAQRR